MQPAVEFQHISKRFGAVQANRDVSFSIAEGSIHGVIGENGAGKSTLMSILYGYYRADSGKLLINGQQHDIRNSHEAIDLGIGMVHQHFMLVENMTVLDNVMLGSEGGFRLQKNRKQLEQQLRDICQRYSLDVDPLDKIEDLSVGVQQRVEILKQIYRSANILILDEPTAVLTVQETASLFAVLRLFKEQGKTIILITHKLQEILDITDEVTVMRAGTVVGSVQTANTNKEQLAELMVGRPIETHLPRAPYAPGETVLDVKGLNLINAQQVSLLKDLNFNIRAGEIVAIAGVSGNGQSELLEVLSGMHLPSSGTVSMQGKPLPFAGRKDADGLPATFRELGIAHVPEDRLRDGVVKNFSVMMNSFLGYQKKLGKAFGLLDYKTILKTCNELLSKFDVRPADPHLRIALLSGGNQQKVVMAREMASSPKLMLVGQPTRGVDIGTIESLHARLLAMRDAGVAILLVSVELEEVRALADRILVMSGGCITGELKVEEFDATRIGLLMGGLHKH
ncbi:ABC transporter ATP-binding protein [Undibacterium oligocarboniphilum]|uniref:ABC transporter ATP-binding protein n=1 Tax=Undibacterium oligocarboniphilum TaxID=666702 RepID=A0A850QDN8_9BURK|nr:ABC transporter ATP-binding protein [Undibacterium oligocarboniphilum]MBC3870627.1 ABC transporter ATP-binding protein [Undibacterium oligocarboniphilum]NVO78572.1 ABC transporter ATP-binding protein [Undibacterium oligocarboniphilum]